MLTKTRAILINDTSVENHYGCKFVVDQIEKQCEKHNINIIHRVKLNEDWREKKHVGKLNETDLVLVNGEGSLHSSNKRAKILSAIAPYCKNIKKPCFLLNSVYQNNSKEIAENIKFFDLIFVRESASQKELLKDNIKSKVVPDLIFGYSNLFSNVSNEISKKYVLFSDSTLDKTSILLYKYYHEIPAAKFITLRPFNEVYKKRKTKRSLKKRLKKAVKEIYVKIKNGKSISNNEVTLDKCELKVMEKIYALSFNKTNFLALIKDADLIVTGRFHLACLGLLAGKPVYAVKSNTHKIQGLFRDIGIEDNILKLENGFEKIEGIMGKDHDMERVQNYVLASRLKIDNMFKEIMLKTKQYGK